MESIITAIKSEISAREVELSFLRQTLDNMEKVQGNGHLTIMASVSSGVYEGQTAGSAVRQYMQARKSPATLDEIREALTAGGFNWGKYPKRQVALVVSTTPKVYSLKGDVVSLK